MMKLKHSITIFAVLFLTACQNNVKQTTYGTKSEDENLYVKLSKYYKDTIFRGIYIFPDTANVDSIFIFKGNPIDSLLLSELPYFASKDLTWDDDYFGVYRFKIDSVYTGFLTRVPGVYTSSDLSIWIFDRKKDQIVASLDVAALFGDAGDCVVSNSYVFIDNDFHLNILNRLYSSYDHSVEDSTDLVMDVFRSYLHTRWSNNKIDTLSKDSMEIMKIFPKQI